MAAMVNWEHRKILRSVTLLSFLGISLATDSIAADEIQSERSAKGGKGVKRFVESWTQAFIDGKTNPMMKHYAKREDLRVTFSSGRRLSAHEAVSNEYDASFKDGTFLESELVDPVMRRVGDAAYVHGEHKLIMQFPGDPAKYRLHVRTTLVLEKIEGDWQIVLEHSSTIQDIPRIQPVQSIQ